MKEIVEVIEHFNGRGEIYETQFHGTRGFLLFFILSVQMFPFLFCLHLLLLRNTVYFVIVVLPTPLLVGLTVRCWVNGGGFRTIDSHIYGGVSGYGVDNFRFRHGVRTWLLVLLVWKLHKSKIGSGRNDLIFLCSQANQLGLTVVFWA